MSDFDDEEETRELGPDERGPYVYRPGELADDVDLLGLVRRYERSQTDIDQSLKDIKLLLQMQRQDQANDRARVDQLEREMVEHRKYVDELGQRRKAAAKKVK
jgi:DNA-binding transcriptional MerR regulator